MASRSLCERWLLELTRLPTAPGREQRVIAWVRQWAQQRNVRLHVDSLGNLELRRSAPLNAKPRGKPLYFTAHLDHPALVVRARQDSRHLLAEFRGGVDQGYFRGSQVLLYHGEEKAQRGVVTRLLKASTPKTRRVQSSTGFPLLVIRFSSPVQADPGDVLTWDTGRQSVRAGRLHTSACDNLAGVAAALSAFDAVNHHPAAAAVNLRLYLTRAEEVGFIGAVGACKQHLLPREARLIVLENSKSIPGDSPIGAGPIVRVGDRASTFDPPLTLRLCQMAQELDRRVRRFQWQRKLMPGGTCEATAFQVFGYTTACLCLPLGNYHNMNPRTGRIAAEFISLADYHGLIRLLTETALHLDRTHQIPTLKTRLNRLYARHRNVLR